MKYSTCWATFTGYPLISQWNLDADGEPLLTEALQVLAPKAAVFELTEDDKAAAELRVSALVDEMVHAVLAQFTVMSGMQDDLKLTFPHATELERFHYTRGCLTDDWRLRPSSLGIGDIHHRGATTIVGDDQVPAVRGERFTKAEPRGGNGPLQRRQETPVGEQSHGLTQRHERPPTIGRGHDPEGVTRDGDKVVAGMRERRGWGGRGLTTGKQQRGN
jgi:hypothetical protein